MSFKSLAALTLGRIKRGVKKALSMITLGRLRADDEEPEIIQKSRGGDTYIGHYEKKRKLQSNNHVIILAESGIF